MSSIIETCTADYTARVQHARRADGQWFTRIQTRDARFGYKWTAWRETSFAPEGGREIGKRARLPK